MSMPSYAEELQVERSLSGVVINDRMAAATDIAARTLWRQMIAEPERFAPASGFNGIGLGSDAHWLRLDFQRTEL
ncbi:MAG TPA: hypothetical protein PKJ85_10065, partial [Nitrosomonas nitrosa]|nr:hypothetical protein [Nitrosomonas nitrosa]